MNSDEMTKLLPDIINSFGNCTAQLLTDPLSVFSSCDVEGETGTVYLCVVRSPLAEIVARELGMLRERLMRVRPEVFQSKN